MQMQSILSWAHLLDASSRLIPYSVPPSQRHLADRLPHIPIAAVNCPSSMPWANTTGFREILTRSMRAHRSPKLSIKWHSASCYTSISNVILPFFLQTSPHPPSSSFPFFLLTYLFYLTWHIGEFFGTESVWSNLIYQALRYDRRSFWTCLPSSGTMYIFSFTHHKTLQPSLLSTFSSTELRKIKQVTQDDKT